MFTSWVSHNLQIICIYKEDNANTGCSIMIVIIIIFVAAYGSSFPSQLSSCTLSSSTPMILTTSACVLCSSLLQWKTMSLFFSKVNIFTCSGPGTFSRPSFLQLTFFSSGNQEKSSISSSLLNHLLHGIKPVNLTHLGGKNISLTSQMLLPFSVLLDGKTIPKLSSIHVKWAFVPHQLLKQLFVSFQITYISPRLMDNFLSFRPILSFLKHFLLLAT